MYSLRLLPVGAPVAAGLSTTAHGAVIGLAILGLLVMLLVVRQVRLRTGADADHSEGGPPR